MRTWSCSVLSALAVLLMGASVADAAPPTPRDLLAANTRPLTFSADTVGGPGGDHLMSQMTRAQFVLVGESHFDRDTPVLVGGLYERLRKEQGFRYLVVEQDPIAIEAVNSPTLRGDLSAIAAYARRYEAHIGFAADPDLGLLARVSRYSRRGDPAIWGLEQAQGSIRYLEEIVALAPDADRRTMAEALLDKARVAERRTNQGGFLHDDPAVLPALEALKAAYAAKPGSRADRLIEGLRASAEIYSFNRRAITGERVGLYNNTYREALFKQGFMASYRRAARPHLAPKAVFKFGDWHMYRGRSPGSAFTIGNFAHEFAISNGMEGYGVSVMALGGHYASPADYGAWIAPLFPDGPPAEPVVIDLRPLKPYARDFVSQVAVADQWMLRDFIHGFDAVVVLPNSAKASFTLTGFPSP